MMRVRGAVAAVAWLGPVLLVASGDGRSPVAPLASPAAERPRAAALPAAAASAPAVAKPAGAPAAPSPAAARRADARSDARRPAPSSGRPRYDEPLEALRFYAMKRAPVGQRAVPVRRYAAARQRMSNMRVYSTRQKRMLPAGSRPSAAPGGPPAASSAPGTTTAGPPSESEALSEGTALDTWSPLGPGNIGGRTRGIVIHPTTPDTMYAAGAAGGVWKTTNAGASWAPLGDTMANLAVNALAMDPGNPDVLYAGTGEGYFNLDAVRGAGIFKTTDGGATWTQLSATTSSSFYYVNDVVVSPADGQRVYAATSNGVWRSLDGGTSWTRVLNPPDAANPSQTVIGGCLDLAIRSDQPTDHVLASCGTFFQATVYRNTDAGGSGTWNGVLTEAGMGRTSLALAPSNPAVVYAMAASIENGSDYQDGLYAVFRSLDGGATWSARVRNTDPVKLNTVLLSNTVEAFRTECGFGASDFFNQGWYDNVIAVDPADPNVVWAGGIDLFRSDDGGANWGLASHWWGSPPTVPLPAPVPEYVHADQHVLVFHPQYDGVTNKTLIVGNDGGIFKTTDARAATAAGPSAACDNENGDFVWSELNNGFGVTQFYYGVPYPDGTSYFGGSQDNGTVRGSDAGGANAWTKLLGGDGGAVAVDPTNTSVLYAENYRLSIQKSTDGGATWSPAISGITESPGNFLFIAPFVMDPGNPQRLWTGGYFLWRTSNGASSWSQASAITAGSGSVSAIAVAPSNPDYVLAGMSDGIIHRTTAGTTSGSSTSWPWVQPRSGHVSSLAFDPQDASVAYATYSTFGGSHVWKSVDGGASWSAIDGSGATGLPDLPVHALVVDPNNRLTLYIGTDLGVFTSIDGGATWAVENTGFANVVTEALVRNGTNLYAFTHGRGAWRVPTTAPAATIAVSFDTGTSLAAEGGPSVTATVRVTNSTGGVLPAEVTVAYATTPGSATSPADYTHSAGTLTFPAGSASGSSQNVVVPVGPDDGLDEGVETFTIDLSSPTGATLGAPNVHTVSLRDRVQVAFTSGGNGWGEGISAVPAVVVTTADGSALSSPVTVQFSTSPGSATPGLDYVAASGTLSFPIGTASGSTQSPSVPVLNDALAEGLETFTIALSSPSGAYLGTPSEHVVTILNDWGLSWTGTNNHLRSVHFPAEMDGWIAGDSATLRHTTDGGASWTSVSTGISGTPYFNTVRFLDTSTGWAGSSSHVVSAPPYSVHIARTADAGASWQFRSVAFDDPNPPVGGGTRHHFFNRLFPVSFTQAWSAGGTSVGCRSLRRFTWATGAGTSGGSLSISNFNACVVGQNRQLVDLHFVDANTGWAVGVAGQILKITNATGSPTIATQTSGTTQVLEGVHMLDANTGWVVGANGTILKTTNGGTNWTAQTSGTTTNLHDVHFKDASVGFAVGDNGLLLRTANGGATWTTETTGINFFLTGVHSPGSTYAVGASGYMLKRTECGYGIAPTSVAVAGTAASGSVAVTATATCSWSAQSNDGWITVTGGATGIGNGTVNYDVAANNSASPRSGTATIAGQTFTVDQDGLASHVLTVSRSGDGGGTVTSSPAGIDCGADCSESYLAGTEVTLTATADATSLFTGWSGACSGTGQCMVTMDQARSVDASFANNVFLLTVSRTGGGTVTSEPAGISCGATCSAAFESGSLVTLTATPDSGATFAGWSGACTGTGSCQVTMDAAKSVSARFTYPLTVTRSGSGGGTVTSTPAGIDCGSACAADFDGGAMVTLSAAADANSTFAGWSGACGGTGSCEVTMDGAKSVSATFTVVQRTLTVTRTGGGTVTSDPAGIDCGSTCQASYDHGTLVTLTASADPGATFAGWSGSCTGTGTCQVTMDASKSVSARFTYPLTVTRSGSGGGTVTSTPSGIDCGSTCQAGFDGGSMVTLSAAADGSSTFTGWSGACSGTGSCQVTMDGAKAVDASFAPAASQSWVELTPAPPLPPARTVHTGVYDDANDKLIVFGGYSLPAGCSGYSGSGTFYSDVWVLSGAAGFGAQQWSEITPAAGGPGTRWNHSAVYDPGSNRMIVYSGDLSQNDVWVLENANGMGGTPAWTQLATTNNPPLGRTCHSAVYDPATNRMIVFGGVVNYGPQVGNDVWVLENANGLGGTPSWTQLSPTGGPPPARGEHTAVYDAAGNRMIVFGGGNPGPVQNDVWVLENANGLGGTPAWTQLSPSGTAPAARHGAAAAYDPATNRMLLFSGTVDGNTSNDTWLLTNADGTEATAPAWVLLTPTAAPPARRSPVMAYDSANRAVVFGGDDYSTGRNDTWVLTSANGLHLLSVARSGAGGGSVTSNPAGIDCGSDCSEAFGAGTEVTLTALPDAGSVLASWTGCDSSAGNECTVAMGVPRSVTATFVPVHTLTVSRAGTGGGAVTSSPAGIDCGSDCSEDFPEGTSVDLTATPDATSDFAGWSGDCSGTGACTVLMDAAKAVTATFTRRTHTVTVVRAGGGSGSVASDPGGIDCGGSCSAVFDEGTQVTLTAAAGAGSGFAGFSGGCTSLTSPCALVVSGPATVTATFDAAALTSLAVYPPTRTIDQGATQQFSAVATFADGSKRVLNERVHGTGLGEPSDVAVDATHVYWVERSNGTLKKAPRGGGTAVTLASGLASPTFVVVAGGQAVFSEDATPFRIGSVPVGGGTVTTLATVTPDIQWNGGAKDLAADADHVYWTQGCCGVGSVRRVPVAGGAVEVLVAPAAGGSPVCLAVDSTSVYFHGPAGLVRCGTSSHPSAEVSAGDIYSAPKTGGAATNIHSGLTNPSNLAVDATHVYWAEQGHCCYPGRVKRVPRGGGAMELLTESLPTLPSSQVYHIEVDGGQVLLTDPAAGLVRRVPATGGAPETVLSGLATPAAFALGGSGPTGRIFVAEETGTGRVLSFDRAGAVSWSSGNEPVATVDEYGLASALSAGNATITASFDAASADATLTVRPTLSSIAISPADPSVGASGSVELAAIGTFSDASTRELTDGPGSWAYRMGLPAARRVHAVTASDGRVFAFGGCASSCSDPPVNPAYSYDPATNAWTTLAQVPEFVIHGAAVAPGNGKVYLIGGYYTGGTVLEYDPALDAWSYKASMPTPRYALQAVAYQGRIYAIGGADGNLAVEVYDPAADTWETRNPMPGPQRGAVVAAIGAKIYLAGGSSDGLGNNAIDTVREYDPATDTWATKASLPQPRGYVAGGAIRGRLYVAGGVTFPTVHANVYEYDPASDSWTERAPMLSQTWQAGAALVDDRLFVVGGVHDAASNASGTVEAFDAPEVFWSSGTPASATIGQDGVATGVARGTSTVTARYGALTGDTLLTVVNTPPVAVDDSVFTDEDTPVQVSVRANDTDADGDTLAITAVTQGANGTVANNGGLTVTYTPALNFNGVDTFTYTVSDGQGGGDTASVEVTVTAVNDPPVLSVPGRQYVQEGQLLSFMVSGTDPDAGATLSYSATNVPAGASFDSGTRTFTWTPGSSDGRLDPYVVTFEVSDGLGGTASGTVSITVVDPGATPARWRERHATFGGYVLRMVRDAGGTLFLSTSGGVFKSTDDGGTWTSAKGNLPAWPNNTPIAADPVTAGKVYVWLPDGLYRTLDGGGTWTRLSLNMGSGAYAQELSVAPSDANRLYVASWGDYFWRSVDGGETWTRHTSGLSGGWSGPAFLTSAGVDPSNADVVYTSPWRGNVFKSTDGGQTWTSVGNAGFGPGQIHVSATDPMVLYTTNESAQLVRSADGGASWSSTSLPSPPSQLKLSPADGNVVYAATNGGVYKTTTGGSPWTLLFAPSGQTALASVGLGSGSQVFAGSYASGFYRTLDGTTWTQQNQGLGAASVAGLEIVHDSPSRMYAGVQSYGYLRSTDGGLNWSPLGFETHGLNGIGADPTNPELVAFSSWDGSTGRIRRSTDGGTNFSVTGPSGYASPWLRFNPWQPSLVYMSISDWQGGFLRSTDGGVNWSVPFNWYIYPRDYVFHPSLSNVMFNVGMRYTGASLNTLHVTWSNDQGGSWANPGLQVGQTLWDTDLALDLRDPSVLYVSTGIPSEGTSGIYKYTVSYSGGAVTGVTRVPGTFNMGLGNTTVRDLLYEPAQGCLFAATAGGIYRSCDQAASWTLISAELPYAPSMWMAATPDGSRLFAGTGGGIWEYGPNAAPALVNDAANTVENVAVDIDVRANDGADPDGDALTLTAVTQGTYGTVTINGDGTVRYSPNPGYFGPDSFTYTVSDGVLSAMATVNVYVAAGPRTISIANATVTEGNAGTKPSGVTVSLSAPTDLTVQVSWTAAGGNATAGTDYTGTSGSLTFLPGQVSKPVPVNVVGDTLDEPNEAFVVTLSSPVNATIATGQAQGAILDDDGRPALCQPIATLPFTITSSDGFCLVQTMTYGAATGAAITIASDGVLLDLKGFTLAGPGAADTESIGIYALNRSDIAIVNGSVVGFQKGIVLADDSGTGANASGLEIRRMRVADNTFTGIQIEGRGSVVRGNLVLGTGGTTAFGADADAYAVLVRGDFARVIDNDVVEFRPTGAGQSFGIKLVGANRSFVERNRVGNTTDPTGLETPPEETAIYVGTAADVLVAQSRLHNVKNGVVFDGATGKYRDNLSTRCVAPFAGGTDAGNNQ